MRGVPAIAVNVLDLTLLPPVIARLLLQGYASVNSPIVDAEPGRVDGRAVVLDGPAARDGERLAALAALLVGPVSRRAGRPIRVYRQGPRGGWWRVTREEVYRCVGS